MTRYEEQSHLYGRLLKLKICFPLLFLGPLPLLLPASQTKYLTQLPIQGTHLNFASCLFIWPHCNEAFTFPEEAIASALVFPFAVGKKLLIPTTKSVILKRYLLTKCNVYSSFVPDFLNIKIIVAFVRKLENLNNGPFQS